MLISNVHLEISYFKGKSWYGGYCCCHLIEGLEKKKKQLLKFEFLEQSSVV
jgi:hypothetical protein